MPTLHLLRHAKSSWDDPALADFDRPLAPRGVAAALRMGGHLREQGIVPALVLCSTGRRTRQTWDLVVPALIGTPVVEFRDDLYEAPPDRLLATLRETPAEMEAVLLLGHNPGLQDLARHLAGTESDRRALKRLHRKFPTAALAGFEIDRAWAGLAEGGARLTSFVRPKDLKPTRR